MKKISNKTFIGVVLLLIVTFSVLVSADSFDSADTQSPPVIKSITIINNGENPTIQIRGENFGKDPKAVMVQLNGYGQFVTPQKVKAKKLTAQLPGNQLCTGNVNVVVLVDHIASQPATFSFQSPAPVLQSIEPKHATTGTIIQLKGNNFSCDPDDNQVTINNVATNVLSINGDVMAVLVPDTVPAGQANVRVTVQGKISQTLPLTIDAKRIADGTPSPTDPPLQFTNVGAPGTAGFEPMFSKDGTITNPTNGLPYSMYDANFYGNHQCIINAPWRTRDGQPQKVLVTLNIGHSNSLVGNRTGLFEKFIYLRVNYPLKPDMPYDALNNPFYWGASGLCTEHFPHGELYYNSLARAQGGVDYFLMSRNLPGKDSLTITMQVVAPDLYNYQFYGDNYARAGGGILPKVATLSFDLDQIETKVPVPQFGFGNVTFIDESGSSGISTTNNVRFFSNVLQGSNQPQI
jgi:hypothetical protein